MSSLAESAEVKTEQLLGEEEEDEDEDVSVQVSLGYNEDPVLLDPGLSPGVHPGVTLVGRKVQESDVRETNGKLEVFSREGTVVETRRTSTWAGCTSSCIPTGRDAKPSWRSFCSSCGETSRWCRARSRKRANALKDRNTRARVSSEPARPRGRFSGNGVRKDDDLRNKRTLYYASASVTHAATRTFDMLFNKPEGAAAAFDLTRAAPARGRDADAESQ
jgi:hypothetical protein